MTVAKNLRNRIPTLIKERGISISELQRQAGLSWPAAHNIATVEMIPDETRIGTLRKVGDILQVSIGELVAEEN